MSMSGNARGKLIVVIGLLLILMLLAWQAWRMWGRVPPRAMTPVLPPLEQPLPIGRETPPAPPVEVPEKILPKAAPNPKKIIPAKKHVPGPAPTSAAPISAPVSVPVPVAPSAPPPPEPTEWKGNDTAITHSGQVVIRNDHQWISFWSEHRPHEAAPDVDFSQNMVIGVFAGERPADQFSIVITDVRTVSGSLVVYYREIPPPTGTFAVNVSVYPYDIKVVPLSTLPVKFIGSVDNSGR